MDIEIIQSALTSFHLKSFGVCDGDVLEMMGLLNGPEEFASYATSLKSDGNSLFKQGNFRGASSKYVKAVKAICYVVALDGEGILLLRNLAVFLNLNLAVCALRLCDYALAKDLCSLVLSFDSRNVKALFRRACALVHLGAVEVAREDLVFANCIEDGNSDVLKKLAEVDDMLQSTPLIPDPASFSLDKVCQQSSDRAVLKIDVGLSPTSSGQSEVCDSSSVTRLDSDVVQSMDIDCPMKSLDYNLDRVDGAPRKSSSVDGSTHHTFVNHKQSGSSLRLSQNGINRLAEGHEMTLFHRRSMSFLTVRAVNEKTQIQMEAPSDLESREASVSTIPLASGDVGSTLGIIGCGVRCTGVPPSMKDALEDSALSAPLKQPQSSFHTSPMKKQKVIVPQSVPLSTRCSPFCRDSQPGRNSSDSTQRLGASVPSWSPIPRLKRKAQSHPEVLLPFVKKMKLASLCSISTKFSCSLLFHVGSFAPNRRDVLVVHLRATKQSRGGLTSREGS